MRTSHIFVATLVALGSITEAAAGVNVGKGTDVIPPDSKEASDLHKSDNARKTAPKDNSYEKIGSSDKLSKDLKVTPQKETTEKTDLEDLSADISVPGADDHPVVLNDYDPNNLGNGDKDPKDKTTDDEKIKDTKSKDSKAKDSASNAGTGAGAAVEGSGVDAVGAVGAGDGAVGAGGTGAVSGSAGSAANANSPSKDSTTAAVSSIIPDTTKSATYKEVQEGLHSFYMSLSMIIFSEIGDKTFLIAALMAMKHSRLVVFSSAFASLILMTVLSALLGHTLPTLLSKKLTSFLAAGLFVVFGARLLREGLAMDSQLGVEEEMHEVEEEINEKEFASKQDDIEQGFGEKAELRRSSSNPRVTDDGLETGASDLYKTRPKKTTGGGLKQFTEGVTNLASLVFSPVWVSVFVMTFLGEWGDRSQIATIAMAAGSDYWLVILGAIVGHGLCTGAAVIGGKLLAAKISLKTITISGALAFLVFSIIYLAEAISLPW